MPDPHSLNEWVVALKEGDAKVRRQAAQALGLLGAGSEEAARALGRAVSDSDDQVASLAMDSLGALGTDAVTEIPVLIAVIREPVSSKEGRGRRAANALVDIGQPAVGPLIKLLADPSHEVSALAVSILNRIGPDSLPALPALIREAEARDNVSFYELRVAEAIGGIGPGAAIAAPKLEAMLRRQDFPSDAAESLICALADIGSPPLQFLREKVVDLGNPSRIAAIESLGKLEEKARPVASVLVSLLRTEKDPDLIVATARALSRINPAERSLLPTATELLKEDPWGASDVMRNLGPRARSALPVLHEVLKKPGEMEGRSGVVRALPRIDPKGEVIVPWLVRALTDPDFELGVEAAEALGQIGPPAASAAPALARFVAEVEREPLAPVDPRESAAWALGQIGQAARPAVPILINIVDHDQDPESRRIALAALAGIGSGARDAIPALTLRLKTDDWPWVVEALSQIVRPGDEATISALVRTLGEKDCSMWSMSRLARALSRMGPEARNAARTYYETNNHLEARAILSPYFGLDLPEAKGMARIRLRKLRSLIRDRGRCNDHDAFTRPYSPDPALELIESLSELGHAARSALPPLREIANSKDPALRRKAAGAIAIIEGASIH